MSRRRDRTWMRRQLSLKIALTAALGSVGPLIGVGLLATLAHAELLPRAASSATGTVTWGNGSLL